MDSINYIVAIIAFQEFRSDNNNNARGRVTSERQVPHLPITNSKSGNLHFIPTFGCTIDTKIKFYELVFWLSRFDIIKMKLSIRMIVVLKHQLSSHYNLVSQRWSQPSN